MPTGRNKIWTLLTLDRHHQTPAMVVRIFSYQVLMGFRRPSKELKESEVLRLQTQREEEGNEILLQGFL